MESETKNHRMLEKALHILEYVASCPDGASLTDVCATLDIAKSSAYSLLMTFLHFGYIAKNPHNRFVIGLRAFEIGSRFVENNDFYLYSRDVLEELVRVTNETAHLAVLEGTDVVYLSKFDCSHVVRMVSSVGKRVPAHVTALGKALLSGKSDEEIQTLYHNRELERMTDNSISTVEELLRQLTQIRTSGFAYESEESTLGIRCIAVPVRNSTGEVCLGISISVPTLRVDFGLEQVKQPLLEARRRLGRVL